MSLAIKIFIVYWIIGLVIVLFSLSNKEIKKGFKEDFLAYLIAGLGLSLFYPLILFRGKNERSNDNENE